MKLGEYIESNNITEISVATSVNKLEDRIKFDSIDMIPVKYWNANIRTIRHKLHSNDGKISIELIAIVRFKLNEYKIEA